MKSKQRKLNQLLVNGSCEIFIRKLFLIVLLIFLAARSSQAQDVSDPPVKLGSVSEFYSTVQLSESQIKTRKAKRSTIPLTKGSVTAQINLTKKVNGEEFIYGEVPDKKTSSVTFSYFEGSLSGLVVIPSDRKAFRYFSERGEVYVEEEDINEVLCIDYNTATTAETRSLPAQAPPAGSSAYSLQSLPGAPAVAYLDFDGEVVTGTRWNGGNTINALPGNFSEGDVTNIWKMISEDYRAFNINITTNLAVFNAAPQNRRIRCIFTPTNTASPGAGGVAYVNSFRWADDTPCWVFNSGVKGAGEAGSHEIGHTLGLSHDGRTSPQEDYYYGQGIWAPIMGVGYSKGLVQWSRGEYANANQTQDDIAIIAGTGNGFGFRTDEAGSTFATAKALVVSATGEVSEAQNYGIISQRTDVDMYSFTTPGGLVSLNISPSKAYPNLDIVATIQNASGTVLATSNPTATAPGSQTGPTAIIGLNASFNLNLSAGTYYLSIDGTGQGSPSTTGYSDYSSIGEYFISGTIPVTPPNQNPVVRITSPSENSVYLGPARINVTATATDADGTIRNVTFSSSGSSVSVTDATSPYSATLLIETPGIHEIYAVATDNNGGIGIDTIRVRINHSPLITIVSPLNNSIYTAPATINVSALAVDTDGSIRDVTFSTTGSQGSVIDVSSPYNASLTIERPGVFEIYALARDNDGGLGVDTIWVTVLPPADQKPVVHITSPSGNSVFTAPARINVTATASFTGGTIRDVTFSSSGSGVSVTDSASPYSATLFIETPGVHEIYAVATDNNGNVGRDSIKVQINQRPVVQITSPADNSIFTAPATINVTATATDADGTISDVTFYGPRGSVTDATSPYNGSFTIETPGTYEIFVAARDNHGASSFLDTLIVTVLPAGNQRPVVKITSPAANAILTAQTTINVTATAIDADGTIRDVTFSSSGSSVTITDATSPYTASFYIESPGIHEIIAIATDNEGAIGIDTIRIQINQRPVVQITSPADNSVFTVPATINVTAIATDADGTISDVSFYGPRGSVTDATSPYSGSFTIATPGTYEILAIARDNHGASSFLDTVIVTVLPAANQNPVVSITSPSENSVFTGPARINVTATATDTDGTIRDVTFSSTGSSVTVKDATSPYNATLVIETPGIHEIYAVATDNNGGIGIDTIRVRINQRPEITITSPSDNSEFTAPAIINVTATATDADGTIREVWFGTGVQQLVRDVSSPYSGSLTIATPGVYEIYASAIDNDGGGWTDTIWVTVLPAANQNPSVVITSPVNNTTLTAPATITITASASDPDGTIASVAFYSGSVLLGMDNTSPYSYTITGATAGIYNLTAVATDNRGGTATSSVVTVHVEQPLTTGINGPSCLEAGQRYLFVLSPELPPTAISWWTNAQAVIEPDPLDKRRVYITYASNLTSVNLSAGVNFSVNPWYKQYDKIVKVGGCPAASPEEFSFGSLPELNGEISDDEPVLEIKVFDFHGREITYNGELTMDANKLSQHLEEGAYILHGVTRNNVIKKKLVVKK